MFSGLIQRVGTLVRREARGTGARLVVRHEPWDTPLAPGESVCVHGACLTVTAAQAGEFTCDLLAETLQRSDLGRQPAGAALNLERALRAGDRIGGHFVTGHVDGVGRVVARSRAGEDRVLRVDCEGRLLRQMVEKGSVACSGISLTLAAVGDAWFDVHVIPFTWTHTALQTLRTGDTLNLETDLLAKYVARVLRPGSGPDLTEDSLRQAGFGGPS